MYLVLTEVYNWLKLLGIMASCISIVPWACLHNSSHSALPSVSVETIFEGVIQGGQGSSSFEAAPALVVSEEPIDHLQIGQALGLAGPD